MVPGHIPHSRGGEEAGQYISHPKSSLARGLERQSNESSWTPRYFASQKRVLKKVADDFNASSEEARPLIAELLNAAKAGTTEVERLKEPATEAYVAHIRYASLLPG